MPNAVVAVFDQFNEAQSTVNELLVAGFDRKEVKLSGEAEAAQLAREERPRRGVKGFFQSLFGKPEEDQEIRLYDEAVRHGNYVVTAIAQNDERSDLASEVMSHHHPVDLDERSTEWLGSQAPTQPISTAPAVTETRSIPVVEEEVKIGKREVPHGAVRIYQRISEVPIEEEVLLREERVVVERVPVDKPATEADLSAFKEGTTEIRESAEEPVVSKTARVVEEVRVGKETTERLETVRETARRTDVEVERASDQDYRMHWKQYYGDRGERYEEYLPAYEYGSTAAASQQFKGRSWEQIEPDLQRDWEARNPGSKWERFRESIRYAFSGRR